MCVFYTRLLILHHVDAVDDDSQKRKKTTTGITDQRFYFVSVYSQKERNDSILNFMLQISFLDYQ